MNNKFRNGALLKGTNKYIYPNIANKSDEYVCIDIHCKSRVLLCNNPDNKKLKPYFRHYKGVSCIKYNGSATESEIHKDAKRKIVAVLHKNDITINKKCINENCNNIKRQIIEMLNPHQKIVQEFTFPYNSTKKQADLCLLDNQTMKYIIEIYNTHRTQECDRPDPWFELNAKDVIKQVEKLEYIFDCKRYWRCDECIEKNKQEQIKYQERQERLIKEECMIKIKQLEIEKEQLEKQKRYDEYKKQKKLLQNKLHFEEDKKIKELKIKLDFEKQETIRKIIQLKIKNDKIQKKKEKKERLKQKKIQDKIDEENRIIEQEKQDIINEEIRIQREKEIKELKEFHDKITFIKEPKTEEEIEINKKSCELINTTNNRVIIHYYDNEVLICKLPRRNFYNEQYIKYWNKIKKNPTLLNLPLTFTSRYDYNLSKIQMIERIVYKF